MNNQPIPASGFGAPVPLADGSTPIRVEDSPMYAHLKAAAARSGPRVYHPSAPEDAADQAARNQDHANHGPLRRAMQATAEQSARRDAERRATAAQPAGAAIGGAEVSELRSEVESLRRAVTLAQDTERRVLSQLADIKGEMRQLINQVAELAGAST